MYIKESVVLNRKCCFFNPLSANPTKWPNTLKQFVGKLPTNCLSVFGHFVNLALKGLKESIEGALSGLRQFLATENPLKLMRNACYFISKSLLLFSRYLNFCFDFLVMKIARLLLLHEILGNICNGIVC